MTDPSKKDNSVEYIPFSDISPDIDKGVAAVLSTVILKTIVNQFRENREIVMSRFSDITPSRSKEDRLNRQRPISLANGVMNLSMGLFYDAYMVSGFVLKLERDYNPTKFPSSYKRPPKATLIDSLLNARQKDIYRSLSGLINIENAVYRSIITQTFYSNELPNYRDRFTGKLPANRFAPTSFALLRIEHKVIEMQVQPYYNGSTLRDALRWNWPWLLIGLRYTLKRKYLHYGEWLPSEIDRFFWHPLIDHRPDNYMLLPDKERLILIDIQEMEPEEEDHNRFALNFVRERIIQQHYGGEDFIEPIIKGVGCLTFIIAILGYVLHKLLG